MRKRVSALRPGQEQLISESSPLADEGQPVQPIMKEVVENCDIKEVDPSSCIPLCLFRRKSNNAIKKLKAIFDGRHSTFSASLPGLVSGTPTSVLVPLKADLEHHISDYFLGEGRSQQDAEELKSKHDIWFGIIDGNQFHAAIMELRGENPSKWVPFKWLVTVIRADKSLCEYRRLARIQNERNKTCYHFESTSFDLLNGLRLEYDLLYAKAFKSCRTGRRGVKINHRDVARNYDGGNHSSNTYVKQAVTVASRLAHETIKAIGEICNMECPDIILKNSDLNDKDLRTVDDIISHHDCRLFRSFVRFGALRGAKAFMNAVLDGLEVAQVNCIYRLRHWSESNDFKSAQSKTVVEQFNFSILSLKEEEKFLGIIGRSTWPTHMDTVKENLLRTTLCDMELSMNSGNGNDALPSLWKAFKRVHPAEARGIEDRLADKSVELEGPSINLTDPPTAPDPTEESQTENEHLREEQENLEREKIRKAEMRKEGDKYLSDSNIFTNQISFNDYLTEVWTPSSPRVDLVLSSIPKNEPVDNLKTLPSFCKRVLKTGCYAFLIVTNYQYSLLESLFESEGFRVMDYCFLIVYDKKTLQRRITTDFPQRNGDIAILAKMPGIHPNGYTPVFTDKDAEDISDDYVKFASLININYCQDKLKKPKQLGALRTDEKSVQLYSHIIKMISPVNGTVFDPISGTCAASIACLETNRSCVCLEKDLVCYRYAIGRARIFATPGATMKDLEDYSDPIDVDELPSGDMNATNKRKRKEDNNKEHDHQKAPNEMDTNSKEIADGGSTIQTLNEPNQPIKKFRKLSDGTGYEGNIEEDEVQKKSVRGTDFSCQGDGENTNGNYQKSSNKGKALIGTTSTSIKSFHNNNTNEVVKDRAEALLLMKSRILRSSAQT